MKSVTNRKKTLVRAMKKQKPGPPFPVARKASEALLLVPTSSDPLCICAFVDGIKRHSAPPTIKLGESCAPVVSKSSSPYAQHLRAGPFGIQTSAISIDQTRNSMNATTGPLGEGANEAQQMALDPWSELSGHPDVLKRIFVHCMPSWLPTEKHIGDVPFILMQVCRQWKEIVLDTPQLWSQFRLDVEPTFTDEQFIKHRNILSLWLKYSGNDPLVFAFVKQGETSGQQYQPLSELYFMLREHQGRWSKAQFVLPAGVLRGLARDIEIYSHMLQELKLDLGRSTSQHVTEAVPLLLYQCTNLKKVEAQGGQTLFLDRISPSVGELHLRDFYLSAPRLQPEEGPGSESVYYVPCNVHTLVCRNVQFDPILLVSFHIAFPKLERLVIGYPDLSMQAELMYDKFIERPVEARFIWLSSLEVLSLQIRRWSFLDYLVVPRLRRIQIIGDWLEFVPADSSTWLLSSRRIIDFVQRNHCALTTFHLSAYSINEVELLEILRHMPDLVCLFLCLPDPLSDTFLFELSVNYPGRMREVGQRILYDECKLCPLLKSLFVAPAAITMHRFTFPFLTQLVFSRQYFKLESPSVGSDDDSDLSSVDERCKSAWEDIALPIPDSVCEELRIKTEFTVEIRSTIEGEQ